jgi:hypothetical protein
MQSCVTNHTEEEDTGDLHRDFLLPQPESDTYHFYSVSLAELVNGLPYPPGSGNCRVTKRYVATMMISATGAVAGMYSVVGHLSSRMQGSGLHPQHHKKKTKPEWFIDHGSEKLET